MRRGGNQRFRSICQGHENKFHNQSAAGYRLRLKLDQEPSWDLSASQINLKNNLETLLERHGFKEEYDWRKIQYQILNRVVKNKIDRIAQRNLFEELYFILSEQLEFRKEAKAQPQLYSNNLMLVPKQQQNQEPIILNQAAQAFSLLQNQNRSNN